MNNIRKIDNLTEKITKKYKLEVVTIKELTPLQKFQKLCDMRERQREIKRLVQPLMEEYRSLAQKMDRYMVR